MGKKDNYNYFEEFIKLTDYIVESANTLKELLENYDLEKLYNDTLEVHKLENQADGIVHRMRGYLIKDFLPPIDREDIALIGHKLDNIEDGIDELLINLKILDIRKIKLEVIELVDILIVCTGAVKEIFMNFEDLKNVELINEKVINVNNLEEKGDRIFEKIMTELYKNEKDPIELIKWTTIYNCLENTIDSCEEVGDSIQDVVMKNS